MAVPLLCTVPFWEAVFAVDDDDDDDEGGDVFAVVIDPRGLGIRVAILS